MKILAVLKISKFACSEILVRVYCMSDLIIKIHLHNNDAFCSVKSRDDDVKSRDDDVKLDVLTRVPRRINLLT